MSDDKIQRQITINSIFLNISNPYMCDGNGDIVDGSGRIVGTANYETGIVSLTIPPAAPINPANNKPYFKINENAWDGEWVAGEVKPIPDSEFGGSDE